MRVGWPERIALKHIYYQVWNRSPVQVGCMRKMLKARAVGWPRGMGWGQRREGGSGWGTHVNLWLIHVNVWQKPLQYCKVISLQLIKINEKQNKPKNSILEFFCRTGAPNLVEDGNFRLSARFLGHHLVTSALTNQKRFSYLAAFTSNLAFLFWTQWWSSH